VDNFFVEVAVGEAVSDVGSKVKVADMDVIFVVNFGEFVFGEYIFVMLAPILAVVLFIPKIKQH